MIENVGNMDKNRKRYKVWMTFSVKWTIHI